MEPRRRGRRWYDGGPDFKHLFSIAFTSMTVGFGLGAWWGWLQWAP